MGQWVSWEMEILIYLFLNQTRTWWQRGLRYAQSKGDWSHKRQKETASGPFQFFWRRAWQISQTTIMESQWIALLIWPHSALTHPKISTQRVKEIKTILDFPFKNLSRFALLLVIDLVLNHETYSYRWTASSASGSIIRVWWTHIERWRYVRWLDTMISKGWNWDIG